jgi:hypothetical protein
VSEPDSSAADSVSPRLSSKPLGRSDIRVPAAIWIVGAGNLTEDFPQVVRLALRGGCDWFFIPADVDSDCLQRIAADLPMGRATVALGVDSAEIRSRKINLEDRLARLNRKNCAAVMLQNVTTDEVKTGVPFHRLYPLRERGLFKSIWIEAENEQDATWLIENSPSAAVIAAFGVSDQSLHYRAMQSAVEMGTGLIARCPEPPEERDLRFIAAEPAISSVMMNLPESAVELAAAIKHLANPISGEDREKLWQAFDASHPAPPRKARHGAPDE